MGGLMKKDIIALVIGFIVVLLVGSSCQQKPVTPDPYIRPPYLDYALSLKDVRELPGEANHPFIVEALAFVGKPESLQKDETPWCSASLNLILDRCGMIGTLSALAVSWMNWGRGVTDLQAGDILIFYDGNNYHVTILTDPRIVSYRMGEVYLCIGGDQSNELKTSPYLVKTLIGARRPTKSDYKGKGGR